MSELNFLAHNRWKAPITARESVRSSNPPVSWDIVLVRLQPRFLARGGEGLFGTARELLQRQNNAIFAVVSWQRYQKCYRFPKNPPSAMRVTSPYHSLP